MQAVPCYHIGFLFVLLKTADPGSDMDCWVFAFLVLIWDMYSAMSHKNRPSNTAKGFSDMTTQILTARRFFVEQLYTYFSDCKPIYVDR